MGVLALLGLLNTSKSPLDLKPGECLNVPDVEVINEVDPVDCAEEHDAEVVANFKLGISGDQYPSEFELDRSAQRQCFDDFVAYTGVAPGVTGLGTYVLFPTEELWKEGDRTAICMVSKFSNSGDIVPVVGSLRGSAASPTTSVESTTTLAPPATIPAVAVIEISNGAFHPSQVVLDLQLTPKVRWENHDTDFEYTIESNPPGLFKSPPLSHGEVWGFDFSTLEPDIYRFRALLGNSILPGSVDTRASTTAPTTPALPTTTAPTELTGAELLEVGDCFTIRPSGRTTQEDCDEPHGGEVILVFDAALTGFYPGDQTLFELGLETCVEPFRGYVGAGWAGSGLDLFIIYPLDQSWAVGDRQITCTVTDRTGNEIAGSIRGSGGIVHKGLRTIDALRPGDCFNDPDDLAAIVVELVPCEDPHDNEVYSVAEDPLAEMDSFPGDATMEANAEQICIDTFREYVGISIFASSLGAFPVTPAKAEWILRHRSHTCILFDPGFDKLTGSKRDAQE